MALHPQPASGLWVSAYIAHQPNNLVLCSCLRHWAVVWFEVAYGLVQLATTAES